MRRRRDEGDTRNGVTCLGNDVVDLVAGQLSALTGLGTLCHLDLYLLSVDKVFRGDTTCLVLLLRLMPSTVPE